MYAMLGAPFGIGLALCATTFIVVDEVQPALKHKMAVYPCNVTITTNVGPVFARPRRWSIRSACG